MSEKKQMGAKERMALILEVFAMFAFILLSALGKLSDGTSIALLSFMTANLAVFATANAAITRAFAKVGVGEAPALEIVPAKEGSGPV
jgi:hypothetical protein